MTSAAADHQEHAQHDNDSLLAGLPAPGRYGRAGGSSSSPPHAAPGKAHNNTHDVISSSSGTASGSEGGKTGLMSTLRGSRRQPMEALLASAIEEEQRQQRQTQRKQEQWEASMSRGKHQQQQQQAGDHTAAESEEADTAPDGSSMQQGDGSTDDSMPQLGTAHSGGSGSDAGSPTSSSSPGEIPPSPFAVHFAHLVPPHQKEGRQRGSSRGRGKGRGSRKPASGGDDLMQTMRRSAPQSLRQTAAAAAGEQGQGQVRLSAQRLSATAPPASTSASSRAHAAHDDGDGGDEELFDSLEDLLRDRPIIAPRYPTAKPAAAAAAAAGASSTAPLRKNSGQCTHVKICI